MKRLVVIALLLMAMSPILVSARGDEGTPVASPVASPGASNDGPHYSDDAWDFTIQAVIVGDEFGPPLGWGPNEDGRQFLLVQIRVRNNGDDNQIIKSSQFGIVDGNEVIKADDKLSKRPEVLRIRAIGEQNGTELTPLQTEDFILGWRVSPDLNAFILDFDITNASDDDQIDLSPWVSLNIQPADLAPEQPLPTAPATRTPVPTNTPRATNTPKPPTATATLSPDDITPTEQDYLDAVITGVARLTDASGKLGSQFADASENPLLFSDRDWISDTDEQLQVFIDLDAEAGDLSPSDRQTAIQDLWLEITGLASDAANNYRVGILTLDASSFDLANTQITDSAGLVGDLTAAVIAFRDDPASFGDGPSRTSDGGGTGAQTQADAIDSPVADCDAFSNYDQAQDYYADHPEEQPVIDPDSDGLACEVHFGRG